MDSVTRKRMWTTTGDVAVWAGLGLEGKGRTWGHSELPSVCQPAQDIIILCCISV